MPAEIRSIAGFISRVLESGEDEQVMAEVRREVTEMASSFPAPGISDRAGVSA